MRCPIENINSVAQRAYTFAKELVMEPARTQIPNVATHTESKEMIKRLLGSIFGLALDGVGVVDDEEDDDVIVVSVVAMVLVVSDDRPRKKQQNTEAKTNVTVKATGTNMTILVRSADGNAGANGSMTRFGTKNTANHLDKNPKAGEKKILMRRSIKLDWPNTRNKVIVPSTNNIEANGAGNTQPNDVKHLDTSVWMENTSAKDTICRSTDNRKPSLVDDDCAPVVAEQRTVLLLLLLGWEAAAAGDWYDFNRLCW